MSGLAAFAPSRHQPETYVDARTMAPVTVAKQERVHFHETVIIGWTHNGTEYDRSSTAVEPLTSSDIAHGRLIGLKKGWI